jgi:hypothetical protein
MLKKILVLVIVVVIVGAAVALLVSNGSAGRDEGPRTVAVYAAR